MTFEQLKYGLAKVKREQNEEGRLEIKIEREVRTQRIPKNPI
jgi:hypothetical protein